MVGPADSKHDKKPETQVDPKLPTATADTLHVRPIVLSKDDLYPDTRTLVTRTYDYDEEDDDQRRGKTSSRRTRRLQDDDDDQRRGKTSSRRTRRLQDIERRVAKAFHRVARAAEHGTSEYIDARDRSEDKRKDGAIVDLYENVARGVSKAVAEASPVLVDVAQAYNTRKSRQQLRRLLKNLPRLPIIG